MLKKYKNIHFYILFGLVTDKQKQCVENKLCIRQKIKAWLLRIDRI